MFAHIMASDVTLACAFDSLGALIEVDVLPLVDDFTVSDPKMLCTYGVDSCFLRRFFSAKSTLSQVDSPFTLVLFCPE